MAFDDFLSEIKLFANSSKPKSAIKNAIHETELFIQKRIAIEPTNIFGCENEDCKAVAKAWSNACDEMMKSKPGDLPWLRGKLEFWTSKEIREREQATSEFCRRSTAYLSEIKEKYLKD